MRLAIAAGLVLACAAASGAPFTPANDNEVVERLPATANDPSVRRVDSLRKQLAARPGDNALRLEIARRYFDLAMAQGDPRYVGYAQAAIGPMAATSGNDAGYWLLRGLLQQYSHDFAGALQSLEKAGELDPAAPDPIAWRAAIHMVQARYPQALSECTRLVPLAQPLHAQGCTAYVLASTGHLAEAYEALRKQLAASPDAAAGPGALGADAAGGHGHPAAAHRRSRGAFQGSVSPGRDRPVPAGRLQRLPAGAEAPRRGGDAAGRLGTFGHPAAAARAGRQGPERFTGQGLGGTQLRDRFDAAALRGDRLHEQEAARFELDVEGHPGKALDLASRNYQAQKEPRDAEILMRAALAADNARAAQPALDWLRSTHYEDPALVVLASQLAAKGATR